MAHNEWCDEWGNKWGGQHGGKYRITAPGAKHRRVLYPTDFPKPQAHQWYEKTRIKIANLQKRLNRQFRIPQGNDDVSKGQRQQIWDNNKYYIQNLICQFNKNTVKWLIEQGCKSIPFIMLNMAYVHHPVLIVMEADYHRLCMQIRTLLYVIGDKVEVLETAIANKDPLVCFALSSIGLGESHKTELREAFAPAIDILSRIPFKDIQEAERDVNSRSITFALLMAMTLNMIALFVESKIDALKNKYHQDHNVVVDMLGSLFNVLAHLNCLNAANQLLQNDSIKDLVLTTDKWWVNRIKHKLNFRIPWDNEYDTWFAAWGQMNTSYGANLACVIGIIGFFLPKGHTADDAKAENILYEQISTDKGFKLFAGTSAQQGSHGGPPPNTPQKMHRQPGGNNRGRRGGGRDGRGNYAQPSRSYANLRPNQQQPGGNNRGGYGYGGGRGERGNLHTSRSYADLSFNPPYQQQPSGYGYGEGGRGGRGGGNLPLPHRQTNPPPIPPHQPQFGRHGDTGFKSAQQARQDAFKSCLDAYSLEQFSCEEKCSSWVNSTPNSPFFPLVSVS